MFIINSSNSRNAESTLVEIFNNHEILDQFKLRMAEAALECTDLPTIRAKSLSNLQRWKDKGTWGGVYDEWWELMSNGSDAEVISAMTGAGDEANRLRQSPPYTGIVDQAFRELCWAEHAALRSLNDSRARFELRHADKRYDPAHKDFDVFFDYVASDEVFPQPGERLYLDLKLTGPGQKRPGIISIALVDEAGREFYAELPQSEYASRCNEWARVNILPQLWGGEHVQSVETIRKRLVAWIKGVRHHYGVVTKHAAAASFLLHWLLPEWPRNLGRKIHSFSLADVSIDARPRIVSLMTEYYTPDRQAHHALHDAHAYRLGLNDALGRGWPLIDASEDHVRALSGLRP